MSISGFVDTIPVSTLQSVSIIESEFVQVALTGRIRCLDAERSTKSLIRRDTT